MLLQKRSTLEELIVRTLAKHPAMSAKEILVSISATGFDFTLRGVYKELSKLENDEIVFKVKKKYRLRLTWLINLLAFADAAYDAYTEANHLAELLDASDSKIVQSFNNLHKLDLYWVQLMIALHKIYPDKVMCLWCPFQWFHLVHHYTVDQFYRAVDLSGGKRYHIFGSDTYLDKLALNNFPKEAVYSFAESPFKEETNKYYTVIGQHVLTVKLDRETTGKIAELFGTINSAADFNQAKVAAALLAPVKASLAIEQNEGKAQRLKKKFSNYFGVQIE